MIKQTNMKKIRLYLTLPLSIAFALAGCDHVKDARDPSAPQVVGNRKVLIEDYTGHKCGNCPAAADTLAYIKNKYPGKIIPIAVHAGFFATTTPGSYPTDLRNPVSTAYDNQFGISLAGNPNGLVNRGNYGAGNFIKAYTTWEGDAFQMLSSPAKFSMKIRNTFNATSNSLNTSVVLTSLGYNTGQYKLVVLLTEDSIVGEQLDYRLPSGSQVISNYKFEHVLRDAINSTWGDAVFASGAIPNDSVVKTYNNYNISSAYRARKCHVVAYVYDANTSSPTYYEVLQAEEEKVVH
jgi:thiol-disulfide isomerase/thioredoxin